MAIQAVSLATDAEPCPGYRLCQFLGRGGYGEVWQAVNPEGRDVAMKFIECNSRRNATRELRVLQSVRTLRHNNLVNTYQVTAKNQYIIIVMELAEGSLTDLLDVYYQETGGPLPAKHVIYFLNQAAEVLDFLNERRHIINDRRVAVRHCDVKPSNLLVFGSDVKLADFSLSVLSTSPIGNYERVGTPNFAAPELFQGWLSEHTDQFSLAMTYCQLRTGTLPMKPPSREVTSDHVWLAPDLSDLEPKERDIVARALRIVPQDRWPCCTEFLGRLEALSL